MQHTTQSVRCAFASRQLGHASVSTTLNVYIHLFDHAEHAATVRFAPTYASLLIAQGAKVAFASRQLGHASFSTPLNVYTHLFDHAEHAATVNERLEGRFSETLPPVDPAAAAGQPVAVTHLRMRECKTCHPTL